MKSKASEQECEKLLEEEIKKHEAEEAELKKKKEREKCLHLQKQLDKKQTEQRNVLKAAEGLLADAEKKMSDATKDGDMCQVSMALGLLEVRRKRIAEAHKELTEIADRSKKIRFD